MKTIKFVVKVPTANKHGKYMLNKKRYLTAAGVLRGLEGRLNKIKSQINEMGVKRGKTAEDIQRAMISHPATIQVFYDPQLSICNETLDSTDIDYLITTTAIFLEEHLSKDVLRNNYRRSHQLKIK